jgi:hypothetical protein
VLWGHEHESFPDLREVPGKSYRIQQPGSSVATSITEMEAKPKYVGVLTIDGLEFDYAPQQLQNVRPMATTSITVNNAALADEQIHNALVALLESLPPHPRFDKPLLKLRVNTEEKLNMTCMHTRDTDVAANPDVIQIKQKATRVATEWMG